jgi:hypothetical protein
MKRIVILVSVVALGVGSVLGFGLASGSSPAQTQKTYGPGWVNWAHVGPTQPIAQALSGIEDNVGAVYYLNPETGAFQRYVPSKPEVSNLTTMDFGQSYLMLLTAPTAMTIPTEAMFLATPTPCADSSFWQPAAEQCLADYEEAVNALADCAALLALSNTEPSVCGLIDDLVWDNQDLQSAWGFLLVKIMFDDDFGMIDWIGTDSAVSDIGWTASSLQSWATRNCR